MMDVGIGMLNVEEQPVSIAGYLMFLQMPSWEFGFPVTDRDYLRIANYYEFSHRRQKTQC